MSLDDISDLSSELSEPPSSPEIPPSLYPTPAPSQSDEKDELSVSTHPVEDMPPAKKRRKTEPIKRITRYLSLADSFDDDDDDNDEALDLILKALKKRRKIVVVVGAGISVSAGIPDFRSSHGLFQQLKDEHKLKTSGKQLFDASVYKNDSSTSSFHDMVRSLSDLSSKAKPTPFHKLLARLAKEDRLLRLYTQNVDGLELTLPPLATQIPLNRKSPWPRTVQLHGGLEKMVCHKCGHLSTFQPDIFHGPVPPLCQECVERDSVRTTHAGKRSHGVGRLRPRMVLYNEQNPDEDAIGAVVASDLRSRPDAVIVVGTSLKIPPVRRIVKEMCLTARGRQNGITMMINKESLTLGKDLEDCFDVVVEGESDEIARLAGLKDWDDDTEDVIEVCTQSDIEMAKSRQASVSVVIETPRKNKKQSSLVSNGIMTPPISIDDEIEVDMEHPTPTKAKVKNPASTGRSIAELLGQGNKENRHNKSKSNSMLKSAATAKSKAKTTTKKSKTTKQPSSTSQAKLTGRVSKPVSSTISVQIKNEDHSQQTKPFDPVRPHAHRNNAPMFPGLLSRHESSESVRSSSVSIAGSEADGKESREAVSPTGSIPKDMIKLLN